MHIRVDDTVEITAGDDRGVRGKVLKVDHRARKLVVEGVNRVYKHVRRSQRNPQGGRLSKEMPIPVANAMLVCGKCGQPSRTGARYGSDGSKQRFCKKCGAPLSQTSHLPYCLKCNLEYDQGDKFCNKCGSPLSAQEKFNQAEAKTQQVPSASSPSDTKDKVQVDRSLPLTTSVKQKNNKYLVLLYFITAGIHFLFLVISNCRQQFEMPLKDFVVFTIILVCGFFLSKRKPTHLAINITFFLLLLFYIVYLIYIICKSVFFPN